MVIKKQHFLKLSLIFSSVSVFFNASAWAAEDAIRIPNYETVLKEVHTGANKFEEIKVEPSKSGGSTLMGLIGRLMGGAPNSQFEGMAVSRYIYTAFKDNTLLGVSHGSTIEVDSKPIHVIVHYDSDTNLKGLDVQQAPESVLSNLNKGNYLSQIKGYAAEDFQTKWEKKRRRLILHKGRGLKEIKYPSEGVTRNYFEKIVRSLRYNVAFVDIAYFISRLPMMDMQSRRISSVARSAGSPEANVEGTRLMSPTGDRAKTFLINNTQ